MMNSAVIFVGEANTSSDNDNKIITLFGYKPVSGVSVLYGNYIFNFKTFLYGTN